jgi:hypothetical protein
MTVEDLLVVLFTVFTVLILVVSGWIRTRLEGKAPATIEPEAPEAPPPHVRIPSPPLASAPIEPRVGPMGAPLPAAAPPAAIRRQARAPVGNLRDVRRGIVLMTILGPCHALEPPGRPASVLPADR